ncbi:MAG TPA: hypothetical protein VKA48_10775 [Gammaproteobacteria bacterium]|nr:hypothetical protein [Gammaproteobacteria bacterium]
MSGRVCHCDAYDFPHRWSGGACDAPFPVSPRDQGLVTDGPGVDVDRDDPFCDDRHPARRAADMNAELRRNQ